MKNVIAVLAAIALLCLGFAAEAAITIETVAVGDPGNAGELSGFGAAGYGPDRFCGAVAYTYNIGKYEVTAGQYTAFLNAVAKTDTYGLYNPAMSMPYGDGSPGSWGCNIQRVVSGGTYSYVVASSWANRPVNCVSYWDACRFVNWLHNGQPTGLQDASTTERGAYTLDGYTGQDGRTIQRNEGWEWAITSEDEWYKAAYYKGGSTDAGYWDYATQSDTAPGNQVLATDDGNSANHLIGGVYTIGSQYYRTNVGEFENSASAYGTFDQCGNVWEWNESVVFQGSDYVYRGIRGGSFKYSELYMRASRRDLTAPMNEYNSVGFRVVQYVPEPVPEPASVIALLCGLGGVISVRKRR